MTNRIIFSLCVVPFLLAGCAKDTVPDVIAPPTPTAPKAVDLSNSVGAARDGNQKIKEQNAALATAASEARKQADLATSRAEALAHTGKASQDQLNELWKSMQTMQARNLFLEGEVKKQTDLVEHQTELLSLADKKARDAVLEAGQHDQEAKDNYAKYLATKSSFESAAKDRDLYRSKYDSAKVYEHWVWILVGGYVVIAIILPMVLSNIRKTVNPISAVTAP